MVGFEDLDDIKSDLIILSETLRDTDTDMFMIEENLGEQTAPDGDVDSLLQNLKALRHKADEMIANLERVGTDREWVR